MKYWCHFVWYADWFIESIRGKKSLFGKAIDTCSHSSDVIMIATIFLRGDGSKHIEELILLIQIKGTHETGLKAPTLRCWKNAMRISIRASCDSSISRWPQGYIDGAFLKVSVDRSQFRHNICAV